MRDVQDTALLIVLVVVDEVGSQLSSNGVIGLQIIGFKESVCFEPWMLRVDEACLELIQSQVEEATQAMVISVEFYGWLL